MDADFFRVAFRAPFPAGVLEVADEFLLLGVDRDNWLVLSQRRRDLCVDVANLRISIGVAVDLIVEETHATRADETSAFAGAMQLGALVKIM